MNLDALQGLTYSMYKRYIWEGKVCIKPSFVRDGFRSLDACVMYDRMLAPQDQSLSDNPHLKDAQFYMSNIYFTNFILNFFIDHHLIAKLFKNFLSYQKGRIHAKPLKKVLINKPKC